ncbi:uncharacterized protein LOC144676536, partial [Cetorhinus maximus]
MSRVCIVVLEEVDDDSPVITSKKLQEKYEDVSKSVSPEDGRPPLVQAIFNGDPDEVRSLIFKKEDVNVQAIYVIQEALDFSKMCHFYAKGAAERTYVYVTLSRPRDSPKCFTTSEVLFEETVVMK